MQELLLLHAPSRSPVVTDLAFNFSRRGRGGELARDMASGEESMRTRVCARDWEVT